MIVFSLITLPTSPNTHLSFPMPILDFDLSLSGACLLSLLYSATSRMGVGVGWWWIIVCEGESKEKKKTEGNIVRIYFIGSASWWDLWCSVFPCVVGRFMIPLCCWRLKEKDSSIYQPCTCSPSVCAPYMLSLLQHRCTCSTLWFSRWCTGSQDRA